MSASEAAARSVDAAVDRDGKPEGRAASRRGSVHHLAPCASAIRRTTDKPRPVPVGRVVKNGVKI